LVSEAADGLAVPFDLGYSSGSALAVYVGF
jgi:hypothetical protein